MKIMEGRKKIPVYTMKKIGIFAVNVFFKVKVVLIISKLCQKYFNENKFIALKEEILFSIILKMKPFENQLKFHLDNLLK